MSIKEEIVKIRRRNAELSRRENIQRTNQDQQSERALEERLQQIANLRKTATESGLISAITAAAQELKWGERELWEDYEEHKGSSRIKTLKIHASKESGYSATFIIDNSGNISSHRTNFLPVYRFLWEKNPQKIDKLVADAFMHPEVPAPKPPF
jgi:hypothetical protein